MTGSDQHDVITVLVVEDDPVLRLMTTHVLKRCCSEVRVAESVTEARERLEEAHPTVVVADYLMPGENGLALVPYCVDHGIPFVLLTGTAEGDYASDPLFAQVSVHLTKPVSSADLTSAVEAVVSSASGVTSPS